MTLTIEVAPELEQALKARAARNGQTLDEYLHDLVLRDLVQRDAAAEKKTEDPTLSPRKVAALRGYGKFAHLSGSVDEFIRRRREEAEVEMQQAIHRTSKRHASRQAKSGDPS
jgi:hypothetical protein